MVAAWQYLQYPENMAFEIKRIIKPKGLLIISFSNRAFWSKAPRIWKEGSDLDHINYIKRVLIAQGWEISKIISENNNKSQGFLDFLRVEQDPFYSVLATIN